MDKVRLIPYSYFADFIQGVVMGMSLQGKSTCSAALLNCWGPAVQLMAGWTERKLGGGQVAADSTNC
jgi:hypothetical protein